jgi:hypothetical protein
MVLVVWAWKASDQTTHTTKVNVFASWFPNYLISRFNR